MAIHPTPEELGAMIRAGTITEAEAAEIMAQRIREQAFATMFTPLPPGWQPAANREADPPADPHAS